MSASIEPEFAGVRGIENTTSEFRQKLRELAIRIGATPRDLANVMAFESMGTFSPSKLNEAGSGAVGLIQFMPKTATRLGTSDKALARMTAIEQLVYVEKYFKPYVGRGLDSEHDLYMAVLYPAAIGKGLDHVLFRRGTKAYSQNAGLDRDRDGQVSAGEASSSMLAGAGATQGRKSRDHRANEADSNAPVERRRTSAGDAARARDGLVRVHRIPVPNAEVINHPGVKQPTATEAMAHTAAGQGSKPHETQDVNIFGAIAGLFTVAAEHYKGRDPELATRYEAIASALTTMMGSDLPPTGREARAATARSSPDTGLSIELPS